MFFNSLSLGFFISFLILSSLSKVSGISEIKDFFISGCLFSSIVLFAIKSGLIFLLEFTISLSLGFLTQDCFSSFIKLLLVSNLISSF